jgi:hypothetical protein
VTAAIPRPLPFNRFLSERGEFSMKKLVFALSMIAAVAFAAEPPKGDTKAAPPAAAGGDAAANPMANWKPRQVTKKDTKGIEALYKICEEAMKKGDVDTMAAHWDFPVYMITDNAAGVTMGDLWTKDMWMQTMKPMFENMPKDAKHTMKTKATFLTDSIAFVEENHSMQMGKEKAQTWTSGSIVVLKDGKWMFKTGAEGGWGDMPQPKKADTAPAAAPGQKTADAKQPAAAPAAAPAKK